MKDINEKVNNLKEIITQVIRIVPSTISSILEPIIFILQTLKDACDKLVESQEQKEKLEKESIVIQENK